MRRGIVVALALGACAASATVAPDARAQFETSPTIRTPGEHPRRGIDLEPHFTGGFASGAFDIYGVGFGTRLSFYVLQDGFIPSINNSVAFSLGLDLIGDKLRGGVVPIAVQWNFWFSKHWSVFGEPGIALTFGGSEALVPLFDGGGRYHFTEHVALTVRVGYPVSTIGFALFL